MTRCARRATSSGRRWALLVGRAPSGAASPQQPARSSGLAARRRPALGSVLAALTLALVTGCTGGFGGGTTASPRTIGQAGTPTGGSTDPATNPALARFYQQKVQWSDCGKGFQCAKVTVPVDWAQPAGQTMQLGLQRLPAAGHPIGSLLVNPGGPGVSGISFVQQARSSFGQPLLQSFAIVGWDPRGVGQSGPVSCLSDSQMDAYLAADADPQTTAEVSTMVASLKDFGQSCLRRSGPDFGHVDTLSTVQDMDVIRAVLGDQKLSYYGASYGTFLGAWYAQKFPWRVGRLVLDGAVDPSLTTEEYVVGQAAGFQLDLKDYLADCLKNSGCPFRGTVDQALGQVGALVEQAHAHPLSTSSGRPLTQALLTTGISLGMYDNSFWPMLTKAFSAALQGDGSAMLVLADAYNERDASGHYTQVMSANPAIYCLDHPETRTPEQIGALAAELEQKYPPLGATMGWGLLSCAEWPVKAVMTPQRLTAEGAAPIVVIGTTGDPATPYAWAQALASQLSSGRLLTWKGVGHTAYGRGSQCVSSVVESYLVGGVVPAKNVTCS